MGFIGSHFIRGALQRWSNTRIVNYDVLTYAANPANVDDVSDHLNYRFVHGDIRDGRTVLNALLAHDCDAIVHLAAESHVDRSILDSDDTITTNVIGTHVLLESARKAGVGKFLFVSTDEVYGSICEPLHAAENAPLLPNSPYAVSKASADMMVRAYHVTYGLHATITRACNNFGPNQYPEKLIPLFISHLLEGRKVPVYGDGTNVREWIYVTDHCSGLYNVLESGRAGAAYNIGTSEARTNLEVVRALLAALGKDDSAIEFVTDRPGHDRRYAIDTTLIRDELEWTPQWSFDDGMAKTVAWYVSNRNWWQSIKDGEFKEYYKEQYGE
jgi:dTDP-glucose 4,6-dehydratase